MKRLLTTLQNKWPELLLEGLVIVGSILLAIYLENWNEDRKRKKDEIQMLGEIENSLADIIKVFDSAANKVNKNYQDLELVKGYISSQKPYDEHFSKSLTAFTSQAQFPINQTAYENLKVKGLDLISNDSLRKSIISTYEHKVELISSDWIRIIDNLSTTTIRPMNLKYFEVNFQNQSPIIIPNDYEELIHAREFKNALSYVQSLNLVLPIILAEITPQIRSVKQVVHDEITRLRK